jgi:hypothetical protein
MDVGLKNQEEYKIKRSNVLNDINVLHEQKTIKTSRTNITTRTVLLWLEI